MSSAAGPPTLLGDAGRRLEGGGLGDGRNKSGLRLHLAFNKAAVKIIVTPNSFKGSLSASQAAAAIARGVREALPDAEGVEIPVADGGEGTGEAVVSARKGAYHSVQGQGPLGDPVQAGLGLVG